MADQPLSDADVGFGSAPIGPSGVPRIDIYPPKQAQDAQGLSDADVGLPPQRGAIDQLFGLTGPRYQLWPERLARGIGSDIENAVTVPGRVYSGEIAADSPEAIRAGVTMALTPGLLSPTGIGQRMGSKFGAPPPAEPAVTSPADVALTQGQETSDLGLIQNESAARSGLLGKEAQERAQAFDTRQTRQIGEVSDRIAQGFDPFNQQIAATPQEAGQVVQAGVTRSAQAAQKTIDDLYAQARAHPGEVSPQFLQTVGTQVRSTLPTPELVDQNLTPYASRALTFIDQKIAQMQRAKAGPYGKPDQFGLNLDDLDKVRKTLSTFRQRAYQASSADGAAMSDVIDAWDKAIDRGVNGGHFSGDSAAVAAWNRARAAYSDYQRTFASAGSKDTAGKSIERIIGSKGNTQAIANDVADFMYGPSGTNPGTANVALVNRLKATLGEQSPEWSAAKQGLFARLVNEQTPGQVAGRLNKFLNGDGREMAEAIYSPEERQLLQQFADLHERLEIPRGGANWSNTARFTSPFLKQVMHAAAAAIGGLLGHAIGIPGAEAAGVYVGSKSSEFLQNAKNMRLVRRQMPLAIDAANKWHDAMRLFTLAQTPINKIRVATTTNGLLRNLELAGIVVKGSGALPSGAPSEQTNK